MSSVLAKKQEESYQKQVRDLLRLPENKKCFDCPIKGPAYVNTTIQTFVCARCSGLVREAGHRVKSISASKFSGPEALALKMGGNGVARKLWLSNYSTPNSPEPESDDDVRAFMRQKYYENKWLDRSSLFAHNQQIRHLISQSFNENGEPIKPTAKLTANVKLHSNVVPTNSLSQPLQLPKVSVSPTATISFERKRSSIDSQRSSISSSSEKYPASIYSERSSREYSRDSYSFESNNNRQSVDSARFSSYHGSVGDHQGDLTHDVYESPKRIHEQALPITPIQQVAKSSKLVNANNNIQPTFGSASSSVTPVASKYRPVSATSGTFDSIISDLAGLELEKKVKRATYTGGILSPSSVSMSPIAPTTALEKDKDELFDSDFFSKYDPAKVNERKSDNDQYSALRSVPVPVTVAKEEEKHTSSSEDDDEEDWQDFCSSSSFESNNSLEITEEPANEKVEAAREPAIAIDLFSDLDPRSMFKRF